MLNTKKDKNFCRNTEFLLTRFIELWKVSLCLRLELLLQHNQVRVIYMASRCRKQQILEGLMESEEQLWGKTTLLDKARYHLWWSHSWLVSIRIKARKLVQVSRLLNKSMAQIDPLSTNKCLQRQHNQWTLTCHLKRIMQRNPCSSFKHRGSRTCLFQVVLPSGSRPLTTCSRLEDRTTFKPWDKMLV